MSLAPRVVRGWRAAVCVAICLLPVLALYRAGRRIAQLRHEGIFRLVRRASRGCSAHSLTIGLAAAIFVIATAAFMGLVATFEGGAVMRRLTACLIRLRVSGTILAIGIVTAGGAVDHTLSAFIKSVFSLTYEGG